MLGYIVGGQQCVTTTNVLDELRNGAARLPALTRVESQEWLQVMSLDDPAAIMCFTRWVRRLGAGDRNIGEASVFAVAELSDGIALTDDRESTRVGRAHGLEVHGTIWLLANACRAKKLAETGASTLIDSLRATGHRLPCTGSEFPSYARRHGLLR